MKYPMLKWTMFCCLLVIMVTFSGCSLLKLPFELVNGVLKIVSQLLTIADKLPKPPPGVIPGLF